MATTKPALFQHESGVWEVFLPLAPVPASRPRVSRFGTYYPKTYQKWKTEAGGLLKEFWRDADPTTEPVFVLVECVVKRPQKLTRAFPRPDVDNYAKAALDAVTGSQLIWEDDDQVKGLHAYKRYAEPGEEPYTYLAAALDEDGLWSSGEGEDVYDLPAECRVSLEETE